MSLQYWVDGILIDCFILNSLVFDSFLCDQRKTSYDLFRICGLWKNSAINIMHYLDIHNRHEKQQTTLVSQMLNLCISHNAHAKYHTAYSDNSLPGVSYCEDRGAPPFVCKSENWVGNSYPLRIFLDWGFPSHFRVLRMRSLISALIRSSSSRSVFAKM